eukprot:1339743-Rhodomonas_salina.5
MSSNGSDGKAKKFAYGAAMESILELFEVRMRKHDTNRDVSADSIARHDGFVVSAVLCYSILQYYAVVHEATLCYSARHSPVPGMRWCALGGTEGRYGGTLEDAGSSLRVISIIGSMPNFGPGHVPSPYPILTPLIVSMSATPCLLRAICLRCSYAQPGTGVACCTICLP